MASSRFARIAGSFQSSAAFAAIAAFFSGVHAARIDATRIAAASLSSHAAFAFVDSFAFVSSLLGAFGFPLAAALIFNFVS